jgi:hypothetical protein
MSSPGYTPETSAARGILFAFLMSLIGYNPVVKTTTMKNADKPFIGIIIVTIAILYSVIAMIS